MGYPVLVMNPSGGKMARRRRRRRRKNPSIASWGMAMLGAGAAAALAYALEGTDLNKLTVGAVQAVGGGAAGVGVSMVSPELGVGIASGSMAIGLKNVGEDLMMRTAQPASNGNNNDVSAIRANVGAIRTSRGGATLPTRSRKKLNASVAQQALNTMNAIRARI